MNNREALDHWHAMRDNDRRVKRDAVITTCIIGALLTTLAYLFLTL